MVLIDSKLTPASLQSKTDRFWELSAGKIALINKEYGDQAGSPVFTVNGKYTTRGWTEWTRGFQYGSAILQYEISGDPEMLAYGRQGTVTLMAPHISHTGVHDHGFNIISTYGNLLRLMKEGKIPFNEWERTFYELALKISGAIQASRWTPIQTGGFIHSFNGPHSLFVDTIRSCRSLIVSHMLGHDLQGEGDIRISLPERALQHAEATARYSVYYGEGRDSWDVPGRTAHESVFNVRDGSYRCPNSQQGYSGFTTWTRGLAWAMLGFAELLEWLDQAGDPPKPPFGTKEFHIASMLKASAATCEYYLENTPADGIPYWDTGAPGLTRMGDYLNVPADPFNGHEPVDSSAAAIGAQGLLRLGDYLKNHGDPERGNRFFQAGLTIVSHLLEEPYLSTGNRHQGLLLHTVYHRPKGWDHIPAGSNIPYGESCMWGDYHLRELCVYLSRIVKNEPYYTFFRCAQ